MKEKRRRREEGETQREGGKWKREWVKEREC